MFVFEGIGDLFGGHMILFILFQAEQDHLAFFCYLIHGFNSFMSREAAYVKPRSGGRLPQATKKAAVPPIIAHGVCRPGRDKLSARTCKKLPVASFCASETAETGRIANGREQGDHVSRRQESYKGGIAAEKAAKPQRRRRKAEISREAAKDFIGFVRSFGFVC